ncbi:hypothetical protein SARC_05798 [Sphaeroforma arctica JP610]|uniref:Impact N-terminal domain-containing protein n=1 Tax=Sphaeroforma arctica JP610 TaxID=667725 RepID=A0A0L0G134_9EUKA|nr:hypothetical protein SARC_05798 [Sphaeroforma arctica JP610]KNC81908.1 hypothetical protein SARC_05798 [Sphaeroforma arctica JP610]|eukprot:XP_014155810.1 hypothetical protein SARC_05798 [Sphaeroforma arctica JP610]
MTSKGKDATGTKRSISVGGKSLWTLTSPTVSEKGSVFQSAAIWPLSSEKQAVKALAALCLDSRFSGATCRMTGFRIVEPGKKGRIHKAYNDDGELNGGQRLLGTLTKEKVTNAGVIVVRWYGGVHIGQARFAHIAERTRYILNAIGHKPGQGAQHIWGTGITQFMGRKGPGNKNVGRDAEQGRATSKASGQTHSGTEGRHHELDYAVEQTASTPTKSNAICRIEESPAGGGRQGSGMKRKSIEASESRRCDARREAVAAAAEKRLKISNPSQAFSIGVDAGSKAEAATTAVILMD